MNELEKQISAMNESLEHKIEVVRFVCRDKARLLLDDGTIIKLTFQGGKVYQVANEKTLVELNLPAVADVNSILSDGTHKIKVHGVCIHRARYEDGDLFLYADEAADDCDSSEELDNGCFRCLVQIGNNMFIIWYM